MDKFFSFEIVYPRKCRDDYDNGLRHRMYSVPIVFNTTYSCRLLTKSDLHKHILQFCIEREKKMYQFIAINSKLIHLWSRLFYLDKRAINNIVIPFRSLRIRVNMFTNLFRVPALWLDMNIKNQQYFKYVFQISSSSTLIFVND